MIPVKLSHNHHWHLVQNKEAEKGQFNEEEIFLNNAQNKKHKAKER